jgi:hypothetical protein
MFINLPSNPPPYQLATADATPHWRPLTNTTSAAAAAAAAQADAVLCEGQGDGLFRFCQQCGKLEPLPHFDSDKRSCRNSLNRRRIASAGEDDLLLHTASHMLRSSSGSSSGARVGRSRAVKGSKKTPGKPQLTQQNTTEPPGGNATASQDGLCSEEPAQYRSPPTVRHAAAAAAPDAACTADVAAALAEAFCGNTTKAPTSSFLVEDWPTHVTAGQHAAAATAAAAAFAPQQQLDAVLQTDVLFEMCTAMEGLDGSCCSCSSTHDISSEQELEQLLEHELRAAAAAAAASGRPAAAAAPCNRTPTYAYVQLQQQASMPKDFKMPKEPYNALGGRNGCQALTAQGSIQWQQQTITTPCWQHLDQQQQGVGMLAAVPAPNIGFGYVHEAPSMQHLAMQQQQMVGMFESNAGIGVGAAPSASSLQQRLHHLQEMQQQLEQLQSMMAVVQLKRQQAAALLDTADAAAAAAVAVAQAVGAGSQVPMLHRSTTLDAAAVASAMGVGVQVPTLRRSQTLESSSNGFCACPTWASFVV